MIFVIIIIITPIPSLAQAIASSFQRVAEFCTLQPKDLNNFIKRNAFHKGNFTLYMSFSYLILSVQFNFYFLKLKKKAILSVHRLAVGNLASISLSNGILVVSCWSALCFFITYLGNDFLVIFGDSNGTQVPF